jgi:spore germination cell wall hydrolase CwlJ-like protein
LLRVKTIIAGGVGLSALVLSGAVGLQLGQFLGGFAAPETSSSPVQTVDNNKTSPKIAFANLGFVRSEKASIVPQTSAKSDILFAASKQDRITVASLPEKLDQAASDEEMFAINPVAFSPKTSKVKRTWTRSSGPVAQEMRERSLVTDTVLVFRKDAPVRIEQSVLMAALKQVREHSEKRRKIVFNRNEKLCLAKAIYFESRSEPRDGQIAVANVVMNRKVNRYYPNTVCRVVNQGALKAAKRRKGCQFSFACDGISDVPRDRKSWRGSMKIASLVMKGKLRDERLRGVTHYHADYVYPKWAKEFRRVAKIGKHIFYVAPKLASYQAW